MPEANWQGTDGYIDGFAAGAEQGDMRAGENSYYGALIRYNFTPKPAYYILQDLFRKEWHTELETVAETDEISFHGFYGTYDLEISSKNGTENKTLHLKKDQINEFTFSI